MRTTTHALDHHHPPQTDRRVISGRLYSRIGHTCVTEEGWRRTSGPVHISTPLGLFVSLQRTDISSKRWIVDRATLRQARSEDLQYVENAEQLDFLSIYLANRTCCTAAIERKVDWIHSHRSFGAESTFTTARYRYRRSVLSALLHQELILRDGSIHGHSSLLLCSCEGRGTAHTHQKCRDRRSGGFWE